MAENHAKTSGPDLTLGVTLANVADGGKLLGHVGGEQVLLARRGHELFAIGAHCTHYGGPLAAGLVVDGTVRCPWHHACFDLRTGEALQAPALSPLASWIVELRGDRAFVLERRTEPVPKSRAEASVSSPEKIVIIGGGAAGFAAAQRLRHERYRGSIVMLSDDSAPPVDRPNLSKDYLAGTAPEEWLPLQPDDFYAENEIDLRLNTTVMRIDTRSREVAIGSGDKLGYDRLLLATGAEPIRLAIPGAEQPHVRTLRSLADCQGIVDLAKGARRAVVMGASFIGLEVAASLRARGVEVHVVAPEARPMERILGMQIGDLIRELHEAHGVVFHLEDTANSIDGKQVKLESGGVIEADLVVVGVGVRPRTELAEQAGLTVDRGVVVDAYLETSAPGVFAAGDIARWPYLQTGESIRVEHWVVAERQGQTAALNMLGRQQRFTSVPFFWSHHYDMPIHYVGHARTWDSIAVSGDIAAKNCALRLKKNGRVMAVVSIHRDLESLEAEVAMEEELQTIRG